MHCVVTAGPAFEPIDQVRRLTNFSTGRLGTELAHYLHARGHNVVLLKGETSSFQAPVSPSGPKEISFSSSADLRSKLEELRGDRVDAMFHAAAVGDFVCRRVCRLDEHGDMVTLRDGKISSREDLLYLELKAAPKIIGQLRRLFSRAWLVGWKFEVEGGKHALVEAAHRQMRENQTNGCVVNGPAYGDGFGWVTEDGEVEHLSSESALFEWLESKLSQEASA